MSQWSANINVMMKAARAAGRGLMRDFGEVDKLQVSRKGPSDFVSKADLRAEETIKEILAEARPNYGWLCEESGAVAGEDPTRRWIVDPLDGTTNFLHGLPHWAVSIALEHKGQLVAAVVFNPASEELFVAEKGGGAWLNDGRIRVSGRLDMSEKLFATGVPFNGRGDLPRTFREMARIAPACSGIRRWGAAALDLAYVAAGRYDGFWEWDLSPWDMAGGMLLIQEAGGLIQSIEGPADPLTTGNIIAAPSDAFDSFAKLVRG